MKQITTLLFLYLISSVYAQKQENIWYFGGMAGVSFNTDPPTALIDGAINTSEGVAVISDAQGNLLFYTDGLVVYNRNHTLMLNGGFLRGSSTTTQSATIIPLPNNSNIYYIFSLAPHGERRGLQQAIVDMRGDGGLGEITTKYIQLEEYSTEKITSVYHENGIDIWVLTHGFEYDTFNIYSITSNGIATPIRQKIGSDHSNSNSRASAIGYMKFSPNGNRLAVAVWPSNFIEIFDFNRSTGVLSNPIRINTIRGSMPYEPYGLEFSPNGQLLYVTETNARQNLGNIVQYNLEVSDIENTAILIKTFGIIGLDINKPGALQLASDRKIYFTLFDYDHLSVITNPNALGTSINIDTNAIYLEGNVAYFGLPGFIRGFTATINITNICINDFIQFEITSSLSVTNAVWDFGDGTPTVNELTPKHTYLHPGNYEVKVDLIFSNGANQTLTQTIQLDDVLINFPDFSDICVNSDPLVLNQATPTGGTYSGFGVDSNLGTFNPQITGIGSFPIDYTYTNLDGCIGTKQQMINVVIPSLSLTLDPNRTDTVCLLDSPIDLNFINPIGGTYSGIGVVGNQFFPNQAGVGIHNLTYTVISNCEGTKLNFDINVVKPFNINIELNSTRNSCDERPSFTFKNRTVGSTSHLWDFGNGITSTEKEVTHNYTKNGAYTIRYIASNNSCQKDTSFQVIVDKAFNVNAFSSNQDGINETFDLGLTAEGWSLVIYNRWSNMVYKSDNYQNDWSGDDYPSGVYYYLLTSPEGNTCRGWVTVLK